MTQKNLKYLLTLYQANRLKDTYSDFSEILQYKRLAGFFFERIYGPSDFGFRNKSIKSLHKKLHTFLKGEIISAVGKVIELHELSDSLDDKMAEIMSGFDMPDGLSPDIYAKVYRECNNYETRQYQIKLLLESVKEIHNVSQMGFIGFTLHAVSTPAHLAGMGDIMDFLVEGYEAFNSVKDIDKFLACIEERENELNDRLFDRNCKRENN